jgi:hypothetical protein
MSVQATPVRWDLAAGIGSADNPLGAPSVLNGTFTYDADTGIYSGTNITTSQGTYTQSGIGCDYVGLGFGDICFSGFGGYLVLTPADSLDNTGGTVSLNLPDDIFNPQNGSGEIICDFLEGCGGLTDNYISIIGGTMTGSVVPVPAAVWLFGSGLGLLGWFRRKA